MKQPLPRYWTLQLVAIILLFSVGASLLPTGALTILAISYDRPRYSYRGTFTANLTETNPMEHINLGFCSNIYIAVWTETPTTPIMLLIRSHNNSTLYVFPTFNESGSLIFDIDFWLPSNNYNLEITRQTNNTILQCWVAASLPDPVSYIPVALYLSWGIGLTLIILAVPLTYHFETRTKRAIQNDYDSKY